MFGDGSGVELLGFIVLSMSAALICIVAAHRYRMAHAQAERTRQLQDASQERARAHRAMHPPGDPLPEEIRNALPKSVFNDTSPIDDRACPICLMEYEGREELLALPCKHTFHSGCVGLWFERHSTCPICRFALHTREEEGQDVEAGQAGPPSAGVHAGEDGRGDEAEAERPLQLEGGAVSSTVGVNLVEDGRGGGAEGFDLEEGRRGGGAETEWPMQVQDGAREGVHGAHGEVLGGSGTEHGEVTVLIRQSDDILSRQPVGAVRSEREEGVGASGGALPGSLG